MTCGAWSASRARTGSSRWCRTTASTPSGSIRRKTEGPRPSTLTTASSITQTGTPPRPPRRLRPSDGRVCMSEEVLHDEQSHYEISLTAGQAFIAFVLLLLSLAASFAFGLTIGKGQLDERIAGKKDAPAVTEARAVPIPAPKRDEVAVADDDFKAQAP